MSQIILTNEEALVGADLTPSYQALKEVDRRLQVKYVAVYPK